MTDALPAAVAGRPPDLLQVGLPGTQELFIVVLVFLLLAVPAVLVLGAVVAGVRWLGDDDERVDELESEVERLRDELDAVRGSDSASDADSDRSTRAREDDAGE